MLQIAHSLTCMPTRGGQASMPTLITGEKLRQAVEQQTFIVGGNPECVEGVKYDFRMSSRVLKSSYGQPVDMEKLPENERSAMRVDPGEVVFVLTQEKLNLPKNMMVALSPKRKLAHSGIIVLGGFAIDPLFNNYLWVGLYNFSSTPFPIRPGKKLIAALFYELQDDEIGDFSVPESTNFDEFPDELVTLIKNYKPIELKGIYDELQLTKQQFIELKNSFINDKQWKEDFKTALDQHNSQLEKIITGLQHEKEARENEDTRISSKLDSIGGIWATFAASFRVGLFLVTTVVGVIIGIVVGKMFL